MRILASIDPSQTAPVLQTNNANMVRAPAECEVINDPLWRRPSPPQEHNLV
jgi:hypothetical protein